MSKTLVVAKYEYLRTVRTKGFWFSTLFLPIFMGVIMFLSGYGGAKSEEDFQKLPEDTKEVLLIDESLMVSDSLVSQIPNLKKVDTDALAESIQVVKEGEADALIYYPADLLETKKIKVYTHESDGLIGSASIAGFGSSLLRQSAFDQLENSNIKEIITTESFAQDIIYFDDEGEEVSSGWEKYIIPAISAVVYFFTVFIAAQFLLQSVSEEKENRMIEMILSMIKEENLLYGKILGLSAVVITQLLVWVVLGLVVVLGSTQTLDFDIPFSINLSKVNWWLLPVNLYFVVGGFLFLAAIMVGVGSVGTSYKDSQSLSTVFILISIFPLYLVFFIVSDPNGPLARFLSFFPFTSPLILMVRNSFTDLNTIELILGMICVAIYVLLSFKIASILFNLGALMYNRRPTWKEIWYAVRR